MARPHIELNDGDWQLFRLSDDEFTTLSQHALPILQNFELLEQLERRNGLDAGLSLGQAVTVLERKFGPSSPLFDGYRGSFSFPLLITRTRKRRISYLLRCHDHRGTIHFPMYRIVAGDPSAAERSRVHAPIEAEFSKREMDAFVCSLHGYLLGYAHLLAAELVASFYRAVRSDLILYGYSGSLFFEYHCCDVASFEKRREELDSRLGLRRVRSSSNRVERLIDYITETPHARAAANESTLEPLA